ncbi:hypothetical protein FNO01nite_23180 [Flavobacterium noncentrifugens]|uniref:Uncharacterized protein n=1 Tax=Flavobacterium noncentrifugens TaxID=1128970 RepID=A0A1G9AZM8_9FLAO|nr:hypothetical protein [Flavobacterium noncentrifugens]GEP51646.1 hypothetical protein FNO01nite_23180 [Flavobacterium noncentrifugens]SDK32771.1 hypothetical protein SAMN04487935_3121 [Flavobacterium noncentrifugens]
MLSRVVATEVKWIFLVLIVSIIIAGSINSIISSAGMGADRNQTFLGLTFFSEVVVFFIFNTFVVFGVKGFFQMYSQKTANLIIFITGVLLTIAIFILAYQILF